MQLRGGIVLLSLCRLKWVQHEAVRVKNWISREDVRYLRLKIDRHLWRKHQALWSSEV